MKSQGLLTTLSLKIKENIMIDNIMMEKIWQDGDLLELNIECSAEYSTVNQSCYVQFSALNEICEQITKCVRRLQQNCYIEFGKKEGNYTPAFSMNILEISMSGHVKIEVDMEIADNDSRKHRCSFYVKSELGLLEEFGEKLRGLIEGNIGEQVKLNY